jgi:hypothetical protein
VNLPMFEAALDVLAAWDDPTDDECCVFVQAVCERAYKLPPATGELLAAWRIFDIHWPWTPVQAACAAGLCDDADIFEQGIPPTPPPFSPGSPRAGRWHVVQGWRGTPGAIDPATGKLFTGHTFLWLQVNETHGLCLDSSDKRPASNTLNGFRAWSDRVAEFKGGVAVAVLRPFGR